MKKVTKKYAGIALALATAVTATIAPAGSVYAVDMNISNGVSQGQGTGVPENLFGAGSIFTTIVNILLFVIGAISVIMLIWGGIRYTTSGGSSGSVTAAKNTIMYAIIGLVVAFLAFAIVNWVLGSVSGTGAGTA